MYCQRCGAPAETVRVTLMRHIGLIIAWYNTHVSGNLCRNCVDEVFWPYMAVCVVFGWCSWLSLILNPIAIIVNIVAFTKSRRLSPRAATRARSPVQPPNAPGTG